MTPRTLPPALVCALLLVVSGCGTTDGPPDDADGGVTPGGDCDVGATQACYDGPAATRWVGACADGTQTCANGAWGACAGAALPQVETCDGDDDDCDGEVDDGVLIAFYRDADGDLFGADNAVAFACAAPAGYVEVSGDCDDANAGARPGLTEVTSNGVDDDCDGFEQCFADADRDGARTASTVASPDLDCTDPGEAHAVAPMDCDDSNAQVGPGSAEIPANGRDENCDGVEECFADRDGDGYRPAGNVTVASADMDCNDPGELGASAPFGDCNDGNASVNPGATEVPANGIDDDCDGSIDEP